MWYLCVLSTFGQDGWFPVYIPSWNMPVIEVWSLCRAGTTLKPSAYSIWSHSDQLQDHFVLKLLSVDYVFHQKQHIATCNVFHLGDLQLGHSVCTLAHIALVCIGTYLKIVTSGVLRSLTETLLHPHERWNTITSIPRSPNPRWHRVAAGCQGYFWHQAYSTLAQYCNTLVRFYMT